METATQSPRPTAVQKERRTTPARQALLSLLLVATAASALFVGLAARRATWDLTRSVHRSEDLNNGWGWGQRALRYGFFNLYDHVIASNPDGDYTLDYTPLRLAVMTAWAHWTNHHANGGAGWRDDYAFTAPLLYFNTFIALLSAAGILALVRLWTGSTSRFKPLAAAILFWLNPALLLDAHGWPQWDIWLVPFFVFALLAACNRSWLLTGVLLGVGAMLKGQLMFAAPLFVLWPLFARRGRDAADVLLGLLAAVALIAAPWMIGHGVVWLITAVALAWYATRSHARRPWRSRAMIAAATVTLFLSPVLFGGSMNWFRVGFLYGAQKFPDMAMGAENLASLLQRHFALRCRDTAFALPALHIAVTVKQLLTAGYVVSLILASWAAARHSARGDARFLVAAVMPWVLFFALMAQMHERYWVWAACLSALWIATGPATTALHLLISATAFMIMAQSMAAARPTGWPLLARLIQITSPALPWIVLLAAALVTLTSLTRSRRPDPAR